MDRDQEGGMAALAMSPELIGAESEPLMSSDSTKSANRSLFRVSEDTAVSLESTCTVKTFDSSSAEV
jgi:hypothetical protein